MAGIGGYTFWRGANGWYSNVTGTLNFECPTVFDSASGTLGYIYKFTCVVLGFTFEVNITNAVTFPFGSQKVVVVDIKMSVPGGSGFTGSGSTTAHAEKTFTLPGRFSGRIYGVISVAGVFREWVQTFLNGDTGSPLPSTKITHTPRWKQGETFTASLSITGDVSCGVSLTGTVPNPGAGVPEFGVNFNTQVTSGTTTDINGDQIKVASGSPPSGQQGTALLNITSCNYTAGGVTLSPNFGSSLTLNSTGGSSASIVGGSGTLAISVTNQTNGGVKSDGFFVLSYLPCAVDFDGLVTKFFASNFGSTVDTSLSWEPSTISMANGVYVRTLQFENRQITLDGSNAVSGSFTVLPAFSGGVESSWASANSVNSNDLALLLLDEFAWYPTTFTHTGANVGVGISADWTGTGATPVVALGVLTVTAISTPGSAIKSNYVADFRNHRTFRVNARCSNSRTVRVTIGSKYWDLALTSTASDFDIDLCNPIGTTPVATDNTDSSWSTPGVLYGVQSVNSIQFSQLQSGDVLTVNSLSLVQTEAARGWVVPIDCPVSGSFGSIDDWFPVGSDGNRYSRVLMDLSKGKQSADIPHAKRTGSGTTNRIRSSEQGDGTEERLSINEMIGIVNASNQAGLTCTSGTSSVSPLFGTSGNYYDPDKHFAGSLTLDGISSRIQFSGYGTEPDMSSAGLNCIPAYGQYNLYYGASLLAGSNRKLRWTKRFQGVSHGLVLAASGPAVGASVTTGSDVITTDSNGYYRSQPYPGGSLNITVSGATLSEIIISRKATWRGFFIVAPSPTFANPFSLHDYYAGQYYRADIVAGNVVVRRADQGNPMGGFDSSVAATSSGGCTDPRLAVDVRAARRLYLVFSVAGNVKEQYSDDFGESWSMAYTVITGGTHPTTITGIDGTRITAAFVSGGGSTGVLKAVAQSSGDQSPGSVFTFTDGSADLSVKDDTFHLTQAPEAAGRWVLVCNIVGDSAPSEWTSANWDGRTWKRTV